jgi:hypothetical protein
MNITYCLHLSEREKLKDAILNLVSIEDLRYYHGWGTVTLLCEIDQVQKLTLEVPVFDFALSLLHVVSALHDKDAIDLDFTESDAKLIFKRTENIAITSNFSEWSCNCDLSQLEIEAKFLYTNLLRDLGIPVSLQHKMNFLEVTGVREYEGDLGGAGGGPGEEPGPADGRGG